MCPHQIDIPLFTVGDPKLMYHRVGFKIDANRAYHMLFAQHRPPEEVNDGIGAGIELLDLQRGQAITAAVAVGGHIGPSILEAKAAQQLLM